MEPPLTFVYCVCRFANSLSIFHATGIAKSFDFLTTVLWDYLVSLSLLGSEINERKQHVRNERSADQKDFELMVKNVLFAYLVALAYLVASEIKMYFKA